MSTDADYDRGISTALDNHGIDFEPPSIGGLGRPSHRKWLIKTDLGVLAMNDREARAYCTGLTDKQRQHQASAMANQLPSFTGPIEAIYRLVDRIEDYSAGACQHAHNDATDPHTLVITYTDLKITMAKLAGPDSIFRGRLAATTPFGGELLTHVLSQPSEPTT